MHFVIDAEQFFRAALQKPYVAFATQRTTDSFIDLTLVFTARIFDLKRVGEDNDELVAIQGLKVMIFEHLFRLEVQLEDRHNFPRLGQHRIVRLKNLC